MDSLPIEIINLILLKTNTKDYTNFILAYSRVLELWKMETNRKEYKEQYIRTVHEPKKLQTKTIRVDTGVQHGICTTFYEDGKKKIVENYKNGRRHGLYLAYYNNGNIHTEQYFVDGIKQGLCSAYFMHGGLCARVNYKDDEHHGEYLTFYNNGMIHITANYNRNRLCGKYATHDNKGNIISSYDYQNGNL